MPSDTYETTYMVLTLPRAEVRLGPFYASDNNAAFERIDEHTHAPGKGKRVPAAGLNIDDDLSIGSHNLTALKSARFTSQSAPLAGVADLSSVYVSGGDLWFNNSGGTQIQLTNGGSINVAGLSANFFTHLAVSTDIAIGAADTEVVFDVNTSGTRTITLPAAAGVTAGRFYIVKDATGSAATNPITIQRSAADTFDAAATSITVSTNYGSVMVVSDGTSAWRVHRFEDRGYLNGATVPAAGALTTGNVLKVSSSSGLSYGAVDLGGGSAHVTGLLPWANIVNPVPYSHLPDATTGVRGIAQLTQDLGGAATAPTVIALTGSGGTLPLRSGLNTIEFNTAASSPTIKVAAAAGAASAMKFQGQDAGGSNNNGGDIEIFGGAKTGTGLGGGVHVQIGGVRTMLRARELTAGQYVLGLCAPVAAANVPAGSAVAFLGDALSTPSTAFGSQNPTGGLVMYSEGGQPAWKMSTGSTIKIGERSVPGAVVAGTVTVPATAAIVLDVTINGSLYKLPLWNA